MAYPTVTGNVVSLGTFSTAATSVSLSLGSTSNSYDTQLLVISVKAKDATIASISGEGWALLSNVPATIVDSGGRTLVYSRTGARAAETVSVTFNGAGTQGIVHGLVVTGQVNATTTATASTYATTATAPSVTATSAETLWLQIVSTSNWPRVLTAPAGVTVVTTRHDYILGSAVGWAQRTAGATGTSGNWSLTDPDTGSPNSESWQSLSIALSQPAVTLPVLTGSDTLPSM